MAFLLWQYLRDSAERYPSRPAVAWQDQVLTYEELESLTTRLAAFLRARGVGRGTRVGIYLPKSWYGVVAMLGISKTGAAYVPVDPNAPAQRAAFVLRDCRVTALITTQRLLERLADTLLDTTALRLVLLAEEEPPAAAADLGDQLMMASWDAVERTASNGGVPISGVETDPAYLLYTSGSTGNPKGVILSHRHAITFVDWASETLGIGPDDRLSNHAPHHFDLSVLDIYAALRCGACVVIVPETIAPFPRHLARWIMERGITIWYSVPSALTRLLLHGGLEEQQYPQLRAVLYAGEPFPVKYLREVMKCLKPARFYNLYGPTETNVCTYYELPTELPDVVTDVPIGRACENTEVFVLDDDGHPIAAGETGELYVRGPTLMLGYWGLPDKTREVMVPNPLQSAYADTLYRTGDIVRLEPGGAYTFIGRRDHMVKSRGYRIELGEIEQVLYAHEHVAEAAALALPDDEIGSRIYAVVALNSGAAVSVANLETFCRQRLPNYMVPERMVIRSELPKTSTGKLDRIALLTYVTESKSEDNR